MSQVNQQVVVDPHMLGDDLILASLLVDQLRKLRSFAGAEVDMSTLRLSFRNDGLGLVLKTSALEAVTVGSRWVKNFPTPQATGPGPWRVLTIDHRVDWGPWITVENGWAGRLSDFHRHFRRAVAESKKGDGE